MRKLLFCLLAVGAAALATPASARVLVEAAPAPVYVAPAPLYVWPPVSYAYAPCRVIRERIRQPNGRVIYRERRVCD
jgi:hypothetical protein